MKKIFFIFVLLVFIGIPQQGLADLNAPFNLVVSSVGERSVRVVWEWDIAGGSGVLSKFIIDGGPKRNASGAPVSDCNSISNWFEIHEEPGQADRSKTIRGLDRGETYCWRVMAQAQDTDDNSVVVLGPEFTTETSSRGAVCGNNRCEAGEDPASCSQDCSSGGRGGSGGGIPAVLENPISSQTLPQLLENVLNFLFGLSIVILPIIILYGGILLLTAGGDPTKISKSRTILLWAVVAFAIILLARGLPAVLRALL